jgi:hypothetical protein
MRMDKLKPQLMKADFSKEDLRPEVRLILACTRTFVDEDTANLIKALTLQPLDWTYILKKVNQHHVLPLFYININALCRANIPSEILQRLRSAYLSHAQYSLLLTRELIQLLRLFEEHKIHALPLKGPVLAATIYPHLSHRQFADLDILVRERDFHKARAILITRGFQNITPSNRLQKIAPLLSRRKDQIFERADGNVRVELHWRLTGRHFAFPLKMNLIWGHLERVKVAGYAMNSLPDDELLLYLCMHGSRHGWERLQWICDIAEFIRVHPQTNWEGVWNKAHALRNERNLALGLLLAKEFLDIQIPEAVKNRINGDPMLSNLSKQICDLLISEDSASLDISYWHQYHLKVKERMRDRVKLRLHYYPRYLRIAASPTIHDRTFVLLPTSLSFLYYALRPIRLAKTYGGALLARISKYFTHRKI